MKNVKEGGKDFTKIENIEYEPENINKEKGDAWRLSFTNIFKLHQKIRYCFTSSPECSREFRVVFLHYQMHFEKVFFITFLVCEIFNVFYGNIVKFSLI